MNTKPTSAQRSLMQKAHDFARDVMGESSDHDALKAYQEYTLHKTNPEWWVE